MADDNTQADTTGDFSSPDANLTKAPQSGDDSTDPKEIADVKKWFDRLDTGRKFDKESLINISLDRRYLMGARGKFTVDVPIAQTFVDILQSFLFTKDPTVECDPSPLSEPPPQKQILAKSLNQILQQRQQQAQAMSQVAQQGKAAAMAHGLSQEQVAQLAAKGHEILQNAGAGKTPDFPAPPDPSTGVDATQLQPTQTVNPMDPQVQQLVQQIMQPYQQKRDDAKQFADTMEVVVQKFWDTAKLKNCGKRVVRSGLSVGTGWMKAQWVERMGVDLTVRQQIMDLKEQIARMTENAKVIAEDEVSDIDSRKAELEQQLAGIEGKDQVVEARGFMCEFVPAQDVQVSPEVDLADYCNARWLAHHTYPTMEQACADYPDQDDKIREKAQRYFPVQPKDMKPGDTGYIERQYMGEGNSTAVPSDAEAFRSTDQQGTTSGQMDKEPCVHVIEIYDRLTTNVITLIKGLAGYAKKPFVPSIASTRGHPLFLLGVGYIDGSRHPRSLISRTSAILDEYNAVRTNYREARRRAIPKTAYDATNLEKDEIDKLAQATIGEMVPIKQIDPTKPLSNALVPIAYNQIDMALFDTQVILSELEQCWGVAEALAGAQQQVKTATEAELQNTGTHTRLGFIQDEIDAVFSDLAQYTAELALQALSDQEVQEIAGPWALWPEGMTIEDMGVTLSIGVQAGSSGKPNSALQMQAWSQIYPQLKDGIAIIGKLRQSSNDEIADCMEALLQETIRRVGDRSDATAFLPDPPPTPPPPPPDTRPTDETAYNGPQMVAAAQILADIRGKVISSISGTALLNALFPKIPLAQIAKIVAGAQPQPGDPPTQIKSKNVETNTAEQKQPGEQNPNPPPAPNPTAQTIPETAPTAVPTSTAGAPPV
jgi:hypothetical protein